MLNTLLKQASVSGNLPAAARSNEQMKNAGKQENLEKTIDGNPKIGTVIHLTQIHSIFESLPNGLARDIIDTQTKILTELQQKKPKYIAVEAGDVNVPPDHPSREALTRGLLFKNIFGDTLPPASELNELQKKVLYRFGAAAVYAHYNKDVSVIRTTSPEEIGEDSNVKREATAMKVFTDEFFKAHPGETLYCVYGSGHTFDKEDLKPGLSLAQAPVAFRQNMVVDYAKIIQDFGSANSDSQPKLLAQLKHIEIGDWLKLPLEQKKLSLTKVSPSNLSESNFTLALKAGLKEDPTAATNIDTLRKEQKPPFDHFYPRKDGCGVSWTELAQIKEMPKVTLIAITEWHGPTQEKILEIAQPNTFSPRQIGSLLTDKAKMLSLSKLLIVPEQWSGEAKNLYEHLKGFADRNPLYREALEKFYAAKDGPFKGLK